MKRKLYYGWWIVVGAFITLFVCAGIGFSTFPVFLKYLEADMKWDRTSLSIASAIAALAAGFATPVIGGIIERFGLRTVMLPGAVMLSSAYVLLSRIHSLGQLYFLNLAVGLGLAATTILPSQTLVSRWFERRRGRAMGIVTTASALGSVLWIPITSAMIESYGWRHAYLMLGLLMAAVSLPIIFLIIRNNPESMGIQVDDYLESLQAPGAARGNATGYTLKEATRTGTFWLVVSATFFVVFASSGFGLHIIPFLSDMGLPHTRAAGVWAAVHGVSIAARFLFGYLSERRQKRYFAAAANVSRVIALFSLLLFALHVLPLAIAAGLLILVYASGMGCNAVTNPLLISESFGVKNFAKIMGLLGIPYTIGMALGMYAGGKLFDVRHDYILAFSVFAGAFFLAGIAIFFAKPCLLLQGEPARAGQLPQTAADSEAV
ncbi:MAG: MFS transporter [Candidatus Abyssobacteria bacterium SURF_5]|uniref:MFS transporter n=1 Tax=Abyssobacteria bacterium (strain SURF_5) TaxID=2093360 RepID=A0A3A4N8B2_ABYX5|nr:MAG: MFS transporter [Candidatus Abyssubacteria bacterium SURF_5]